MSGLTSRLATIRRPLAQVFAEARALIARPENWWQGGFHPPGHNPDHPTCMCAAGALGMAERGIVYSPSTKLAERFVDAAGIPWQCDAGERALNTIGIWNDRLSRKHSDVLAAFDQAIAYAEERGL